MSDGIIRPAERVANIKYAVRDILVVADEAKRAGLEMLYLNIGDPNRFDYETPPHIVEAICKAMKDNLCGYAPSDGIPEALEAIREDAASKGIQNVQDVFVSNGCSEGIEIALSALCNPGENILTPSPGYPLYTALVAKLGLVPNPYFLSEDRGWQPDVDDIEERINDKTRAIVVINPNNPTGSVADRETLRRILSVADERNLLVIADEIYNELVLDGAEHVPLASLNSEQPVLTFDGLSKGYLGPGLRVGWGILSGEAKRVSAFQAAVAQLCRARLSSNHPEQYGIAPALRDKSHLPALREKLSRRRDLTVESLNAIPGIQCVPPRGAFYAFPSLAVDPDKEEEYIADLVRSTGVVVVHGSGFGQRPGTAHFRIVFLPPEDVLSKAYALIARFLAEHPPR
ncbi:MAG TPA: aminotransferase class I/II-fold pyridoxal phosphate-dependent enzyme [Planctomycetes bacterium]|nr:aminotransferase class I/II-fold pyridoxal phosphate-dependent enzyme [Planctomycetota bacterium]